MTPWIESNNSFVGSKPKLSGLKARNHFTKDWFQVFKNDFSPCKSVNGSTTKFVERQILIVNSPAFRFTQNRIRFIDLKKFFVRIEIFIFIRMVYFWQIYKCTFDFLRTAISVETEDVIMVFHFTINYYSFNASIPLLYANPNVY